MNWDRKTMVPLHILLPSCILVSSVLPCEATEAPVDLEPGRRIPLTCIEPDESSSFIQVRSTQISKTRSLQHDGKPGGSAPPKSKYTEIDQFDCLHHGGALSMVAVTDGFSFRELNTETGKYQELFKIPESALPNAADMSACGINPKDQVLYCALFSWDGYISKMGSASPDGDAGVFGAMYDQQPKSQPAYAQSGDDNKNACGMNPVGAASFCSMFNWKSFLVRIDSHSLEYLAKLPPVKFVAGGFNDQGNYFASTNDARFLTLPNPMVLPGYPFQQHPKILDLEGETLLRPKGFYACNDIVVLREDLQNIGTKETFILVLHGKSLFIALFKTHVPFDPREPGNFTKTWVLPTEGNTWTSYQSAWTFQGRIIFSSEGGKGVFEVPLWDIDLSQPNGVAKHMSEDEGEEGPKDFIELDYMGESEEPPNAEGLNCLYSPDPWITRVKMFDCEHVPDPIQVKKEDDGMTIKKLDLKTGVYTVLFSIPFTYTTPPFHTLNAVGISPIDNIAYGCLQIFQHPAPFYLVRFDHEKIEYVAILQGPSDPIAGTFDSEGSFFYVANPILKRVASPHLLKGYSSEFAPQLTDESHQHFISLAGAKYFADIVAVVGDLAGDGEKNEYVLGVNNERQFAIIEYRAQSNRKWLLPTNDVLGDDKENFGAAWNYNGRVFWASNSGKGVFEAEIRHLNLKEHGMVNLTRVGNAAKISDNDGMNCLNDKFSFAAQKKEDRKRKKRSRRDFLLQQSPGNRERSNSSFWFSDWITPSNWITR
mmetsp:Transcript_140611/g.262297  ORF Transcript_140611/g.262297 Transcript_140611/m.262297 type:complete len:765 (+) Transcript_140611:37-2331(+)